MAAARQRRRPSACVPCHERKVRCDAATRGTPCTRCVAKGRTPYCSFLPPKRLGRIAKRRQQEDAVAETTKTRSGHVQNLHGSRTQDGEDTDGRSSIIHDVATQLSVLQPHPPEIPNQPIPSPATTGGNPSTVSPYVVTEDDGHVQTLHRMTEGTQSIPRPCETSDELHNYEAVEYFDTFNSIAILGQALGHRQRRRLIRLDLPGSEWPSQRQRELNGLDPVDVAYLESRGVFAKPPKAACKALVRTWFELVYPYTPVLDRPKFYEEFAKDECSHFLLYTILANVIPYASQETVTSTGYANKNEAQRDFVLKARLLHDFGCERRQLILLQGSVILSSFQPSYAPPKDFRFWLHNAFRIAKQLGLHRRNLRDDLDVRTFNLCRRIWWTLVARDVLLNVSGFLNARCIDDHEVDNNALLETELHEPPLREEAKALMMPVTNVHRAYFLHKSQLAILGAKFLRLARHPQSIITRTVAEDLTRDFQNWRAQLPEFFAPERVSTWTSQNIWIIVLLAFGYRLECFFARCAREQFRLSMDTESAAWATQRLNSCVFELDTLINRAIIHDLLKLMPSSIVVVACNLLAFHIEIALAEDSSTSRKLTAQARIDALLSYFQEAGNSWQIANWTYRVSEWVVKCAGLRVSSQMTPMPHDPATQQHGGPLNMEGQQNGGRAEAFFDAFIPMGSSFGIDNIPPEQWLQDFLGERLYDQLDNGIIPFNQMHEDQNASATDLSGHSGLPPSFGPS